MPEVTASARNDPNRPALALAGPAELWWATSASPCTVEAALAGWRPSRAWTALWWSASRVEFGRGGPDGSLTRSNGEPFDLAGVFELRAFDGNAELRWLHDTGGTGIAVMVAESVDHLPSNDSWTTDYVEAERCVDGVRHLLWGEAHPDETNALAPGWTALAEQQVGTIAVPIDLDQSRSGDDERGVSTASDKTRAASGRIALVAREYVRRHPSGTAEVFDERLLRFEPVPSTH